MGLRGVGLGRGMSGDRLGDLVGIGIGIEGEGGKT
jgi:hypothetical protein